MKHRKNIYVHITKKHSTSDKTLLKDCNNCNEKVNAAHFRRHEKTCKLYFKYCEKVSEGYKCLLCRIVKKQKGRMFSHIQSKHSQLEKFQCISCAREHQTAKQLLEHITDYHKDTKEIKKLPRKKDFPSISSVIPLCLCLFLRRIECVCHCRGVVARVNGRDAGGSNATHFRRNVSKIASRSDCQAHDNQAGNAA